MKRLKDLEYRQLWMQFVNKMDNLFENKTNEELKEYFIQFQEWEKLV